MPSKNANLLGIVLISSPRSDLPGPMVDGDAVRADADVPEALAAAEQLPGVHVAHRAQPGSA